MSTIDNIQDGFIRYNCHNPACGATTLLRIADYKDRFKKSRSGMLFCSNACSKLCLKIVRKRIREIGANADY
jgi:hypothetical protein